MNDFKTCTFMMALEEATNQFELTNSLRMRV